MIRHLADSIERTAKIVSEVELALSQDRKILVLTEHTELVGALEAELMGRVHNLLHFKRV